MGVIVLSLLHCLFTILHLQQIHSHCVLVIVCSGANYKFITGVYYDTLSSVFGCDSVVVTDLTVLDSSILTDTFEICAGDSAYIGGSYFDTAGTYYEAYTTAQGCDSVVEISSEIIPITFDTILTTICREIVSY